LNIYPPENEGLFEEICENGAAVSEFPLNTKPLAQNFPVRNRVISGLSRGILVVEANQKSGALITARFALEQSREVFAIPGKVSSATSCGTNDLIKSGAKMVTEAREILAELRFNFVSEEQIPEDGVFMAAELDPRELKIAQLLDDEPKCLDDISLEAGMSVSEVLAVLTHLELKKVVKKISGQSFVKIMKG
jgi:DNA processing protein